MTMTTPLPEHGDDCPTTPSKSLARTMSSAAFTPSGGNPGANRNNLGVFLSNKIDALPRSVQFVCLALCVFFFFGIHNVLQEAMINTKVCCLSFFASKLVIILFGGGPLRNKRLRFALL